MASAIPISKVLSDFIKCFPIFRRSLSKCPDPADPSAPAIFGRGVAITYRWKNVERSKPSIKEEAGEALGDP